MFWLITHSIYRLRVHGREHIPPTGPVLLVCNHVSFIDWMLVWVACPRPVRFLASASHNRNPILAVVLRMVRVISIDDLGGGPRALAASLRQSAKVLDAGEVLCVFAEGQLTRNGNMLPFHRGFERIAKLTKAESVVIIPSYLARIWGSIFSYHGGRAFWKWPRQLPFPVGVGFGKPLPATTSAAQTRQAVQEVSADMAIAESYQLRPPHRQFVRMAARYPLAQAVIDNSTGEERILNYGKLYAGSVCLRGWLQDKLGDSPYVGVWLPTSLGGALTNIALGMLGKISVNLNYTAGESAIASSVRQTGLKVVITSKKFVHRMRFPIGEQVQCIYLEDSLRVITRWQRLRSYLAAILLPGWMLDRWVLGLHRHQITDLATVIFSSGSTAEPKGILLSHRNLAANLESLVSAIDLQKSDRLFGTLPFFHCFGYTLTVWGHLQVGASVVYWPDPRQAREVGENASKYQPTIMISTATFLRFYIKRCEADAFRSLRILACGAEKLPPAVAEEFANKFGLWPVEGYGTTELTPVVAVNVPDREVNGLKQVGNKIGTIGQPIPGVAAQIRDPETEEPLPIGSEGLLWIKGPNVMEGYLHQPEKTAEVVRDGWYNTGDMGFIDADGFITLTGRLSRFAKVGGEMVPLEKVEEEFHAALETTDRVLALASVPDEKRGERIVVLHLALSKSPRELAQQLSERGLPNLWIPSERDYFPIDEMPVLGSGKLDIKEVQRQAKEIGQAPASSQV